MIRGRNVIGGRGTPAREGQRALPSEDHALIMPHALFTTNRGVCGVPWNDAGLTAFALPPARPEDFRADSEGVDRGDVDYSAAPPRWVAQLIEGVRAHLAGVSQDFGDVRYDFSRVTAFQRAVYTEALKVRAGVTQTYGGLARQIGSPVLASRAVGTALGRNPWLLLVPCHRFIGANGKLTGFSAPGGLATKRRLLALEGAEMFAE